MRHLLLITVLCTLLSGPAFCDDSFKDVPKDHWAAEFVQVVKTDGVMEGYPDGTFKGDKQVTRYELAVALERMITFVEQGLKPEVGVQIPESKAKDQGTPAPQPSPASKGTDPAQTLKAGGYIPANSPLLTDQKKAVTSQELAQALSSVAAKLIEKTIPPPKDATTAERT